MNAHLVSLASAKLPACARFARECSRDSWQLPTQRERRISRQLSREALADARYWKAELLKHSNH